SSAGEARATDSRGRLRRGPPRPPPIERRRWALIIALAQGDGEDDADRLHHRLETHRGEIGPLVQLEPLLLSQVGEQRRDLLRQVREVDEAAARPGPDPKSGVEGK